MIKKITENSFILFGHNLSEVTKQIDLTLPSIHPNLAAWMDMAKGRYHRVVHGHDFLSNIKLVYKKFGIKGVIAYPYELGKDFTTTNGIPIPGTQPFVNKGLGSQAFTTKWLSLSLTDFIVGYAGYKINQRYFNNADINKKRSILISSSIQIIAGSIAHNPILIGVGFHGIYKNLSIVKKENFFWQDQLEDLMPSYS